MYPMSPNKIPWKVETFTKEETWLHRKYKKNDVFSNSKSAYGKIEA